MLELPNTGDTYANEELARISAQQVRWLKAGFVDGDRTYPPEQRFETEMALAVLLANKVITLNTHHWMQEWPEAARKTTALCVTCDNVFAWDCSDAEDITVDELQGLFDMWFVDRTWGAAVWCAIRRNQTPHPSVAQEIRRVGIWALETLKLGEIWNDNEISRVAVALGDAKHAMTHRATPALPGHVS